MGLMLTGPNDNGAFTIRLFGGIGELAGEVDHSIFINPGELLLPGRGVGGLGIVIAVWVCTRQATIDAKLTHQQVKKQ